MAAFEEGTDERISWRKSLNSHPIFDRLRETSKHVTLRSDPEELLVVREGILFAWDREQSRLLTANLKDLLHADDASRPRSTLQILLCTHAPRFNVEHITLSLTGQHVLLWGPRGASVMHLPRRYGKFGQYESGKETINCRTMVLAERFFMSSGSIRLLQAAWHPGSNSDLHVVLLTSDNTLRIYDINSPHKPIQCHRLGEYSTSYSLSANRSTFEVALGDVAVAFDFGPATEDSRRALERPSGCGPLVYPIYILKGNGDVFLLQTSLSEPGYLHTNLQGPLTMHPPAEDNYGLDACSLMCLHSSPVVLVVATSSGILHHCVVLAGGDDDDDDDDNDSAVSESISDLASVRSKTDSSLYVYESVELFLTPVLSEECVEEVAYPILLHRDPSVLCKYYCSHSAGVHGVTLSWLQKLERYCSSDNDNNEEGTVMDVINQDQPCRVAHMICTKPSETCQAAPILGLTIVDDQLLGQALLCQTVNNDCIVTPLRNLDMPPAPLLVSEKYSQEVSSLPRQSGGEPFQHHIRKILQREVSHPILKGSSKTSLSLKESFELVQSATRVLREEYIIKQDLARDEIEKRVKILQQQKEQQQSDLAESARLKVEIKGKAEEIAVRHDDVVEKQKQLMKRVVSVLHTMHGQLPVLSEAEQSLQREMNEMQDKMEQLQNALQQVRVKDEYRKEKIQEFDRKVSSPSLSQGQNRHLKTLLKEETDAIASLVKETKNLAVAVGH
ncbi:nuclear pore complex protein Nup88-like [Asterias rubens]|uniref:nuclear pore complex protein Nup88-like n=1 Tax=Asterias rubens TaxID=7604 RepID=UPI0014553D77|nr:nuclear pore complex protein Nup88-like [Asterias rubens]